jgi:hypothetical protein
MAVNTSRQKSGNEGLSGLFSLIIDDEPNLFFSAL